MPKTIAQRLSALERKLAAYFGGESDSKSRRKSKAKKRPVKNSRKARKKAVR